MPTVLIQYINFRDPGLKIGIGYRNNFQSTERYTDHRYTFSSKCRFRSQTFLLLVTVKEVISWKYRRYTMGALETWRLHAPGLWISPPVHVALFTSKQILNGYMTIYVYCFKRKTRCIMHIIYTYIYTCTHFFVNYFNYDIEHSNEIPSDTMLMSW